VIGLGVLYVFISWMFVIGWGTGTVSQAVADQFAGALPHAYGSAFYPLTDKYFAHILTLGFELFIVTGSFACQMAFFNTSARYFFSMGREGIIPSAFGKTHPGHKSPHVAAGLTTVLVGLFLLGFTLHDSSTVAAIAKQGTWGPLMGVMGLLCIQALCSAAIIKYFATEARDGMHWWKTLVAPIIGGVGCLGAALLMLKYRTDLAAGNPLFIQVVPYAVAAMFIGGVVLALVYRATDPRRYAAVGRFVQEDA
jgi:amino acid transporter